MTVRFVVPGPPQPQERARSARVGAGVRTYTPERTRSWKGLCQFHMRQAAGECWKPGIPLEVAVVAVFPLPASQYRKRAVVARRWHVGARGDVDNLAKIVLDAGNGVLWHDDGQVGKLTVEKWVGAQDEAPFVAVSVRELT